MNLNKDEGTDWNMNLAFLFQLDKVCSDAHTLRQQNNNYAWFCALRGIYAMIHFKIKEPGQEVQEKRLEQLFQQAQTFMAGADKTSSSQSIAIYTLDAIEILLRDLIMEYKLIKLEADKMNPATAIKDKFKNG